MARNQSEDEINKRGLIEGVTIIAGGILGAAACSAAGPAGMAAGMGVGAKAAEALSKPLSKGAYEFGVSWTKTFNPDAK